MNLKVGMQIIVGCQDSIQESYEEIEGKEGVITHLDTHPEDFWKTKNRKIFVQIPGIQGGFRDGSVYSWYITERDAIPIDNETFYMALPKW